jgi:predicted nucleotidyltransferase
MSLSELQELLQAYFSQKDDVTVALLFGSYAKGTAHEGSDVDIAVHCKNPLSINEFLSMQTELSALCHREIDLIDLRKAEGTILYQIMTTGIRIKYEENQYVYYSMKALYFYEDYLPILRRCQQERIRRFVNGY